MFYLFSLYGDGLSFRSSSTRIHPMSVVKDDYGSTPRNTKVRQRERKLDANPIPKRLANMV